MLDDMPGMFSKFTGLVPNQALVATAWGLGTYLVQDKKLNRFPPLVLQGGISTGKTSVLRCLEAFVHQPSFLSIRGMTLPTLRDRLAAIYEGTALLDEADKFHGGTDADMEMLLQQRSDRDQARLELKEPQGRVGDWISKEVNVFGATAVHKRQPFAESSAESRSILLYLKPVDRAFQSLQELENVVQELRPVLDERLAVFRGMVLPTAPMPSDIDGRTKATFQPLWDVAVAAGHNATMDALKQEMLRLDATLKGARGDEPSGMLVSVLIEQLSEETSPGHYVLKLRNVKASVISKGIWDNHYHKMSPRQVCTLARQLGLEVKTPGGPSHVIVETRQALVDAAVTAGVKVEGIPHNT
jgi:hypothetical protein